jgi:CRP/FNR family transcriptional regulator, cyclic AMP receptor protein
MSATKSRAEPRAGTFFAGLEDSERAELEKLGSVSQFPRGATLMFQHEPGSRVIVLLAGRAKVTRTDESGRELMLDIADPGDVLGELAFIDQQPRIATVTALEPVRALLIGSQSFQAYIARRPNVRAAVTAVVSSRFRDAQLKRSQFAALDTMGRLAARLVELVERYAEPTDAGLEVQLPISHEELAAWTGASRAGVSQALHNFRELGWVTLARRKLIVRDIEALRARAQ